MEVSAQPHGPAERPKRRPRWSIAIFGGPSLGELRPIAAAGVPSLTAATVTDVPAEFVADPFLLFMDSRWLMFFEVMNAATGRGEIALASSTDGTKWSYDGVVLAEPFHLSYPMVFQCDGEYFMTPEAAGAGAILLYHAVEFPRRWQIERRLVEGTYADPTPFRHEGRWWMFACPAPMRHDRLALFSAPSLQGPWSEHPRSPIIVDDRRRARPAGPLCMIGGKLVRFAQDCDPAYGSAVRALEITTLTLEDYAESEIQPSPILSASGQGWNRDGMHHIALQAAPAGGWIASVDGYTTDSVSCERILAWESIALEWDALLDRSRAHPTFECSTWFGAACAADPALEPLVIVARRGGSIAGVLPLVRISSGVLEFATFLSDYNDVIVASGDADAARALVQFAVSLGAPLRFRGMRPSSDLLAALPSHAHQDIEASCYSARLPEEFEPYLAARSPRLRKSLRRAERRAQREGYVVRSLLPGEIEGQRLSEVFLDLNRQRFGERSCFSQEGNATFIRGVLPAAFEQKRIRPFVILAGEEIVAIDLILPDRDALGIWNGGFNPAVAFLSPGELLLAAEIRAAISSGMSRFDMLRGTQRYKASWATESISLHRAEL